MIEAPWDPTSVHQDTRSTSQFYKVTSRNEVDDQHHIIAGTLCSYSRDESAFFGGYGMSFGVRQGFFLSGEHLNLVE